MEAGDGDLFEHRQRSRGEVDRGLSVQRELGVEEPDEAGLVDDGHQVAGGRGGLGEVDEGGGPGSHGAAGHGEGEVGVGPGRLQREPEGDRAGQLELDRLGAIGDGREERTQRHERLPVQGRVGGRRVRVERRQVEVDRAVRADRDALDAPSGLGDHPLERRTLGKARRGGESRLAGQHELDRGVDVGVGKAADARRDARREADPARVCCPLRH